MRDKYEIKIPKDVEIVLIKKNKTQFVYIKGPAGSKLIKCNIHIFVEYTTQKLKISNTPTEGLHNNELKNLNRNRGLVRSTIRQKIIEVSFKLYKKLKLVGVGYRAFYQTDTDENILTIKLGYSHSLHFNSSNPIKSFCLKRTNIFISSNSYLILTQMSARIRSYRKPEPYKGKGVL